MADEEKDGREDSESNEEFRVEGEEFYSELGHFTWKDPHGLIYKRIIWPFETIKEEDSGVKDLAVGSLDWKWRVPFATSLSPHSLKQFLEVVSRPVGSSDVIRLADVKNTVLYTAIADLSRKFVVLFHLPIVDRFLRAVIIYIQYFLLVREGLIKRQVRLQTKLRHPITEKREAFWSGRLNDMRYLISREYCSIMRGEGDSWPSHHMNNKMHRSCGPYELGIFMRLHKITARVVGLALKDHKNPLIEAELTRLFRVGGYKIHCDSSDELTQLSQNILEGNVAGSMDDGGVPIIRELGRPNRDSRIRILGLARLEDRSSEDLNVLEAAYTCPEEQLQECNIKIGILGEPRKNFPHLLIPVRVIGIRNPYLNETKSWLAEQKEMAISGGADVDETGKYDPGAARRKANLKCPVSKWDVKLPYRIPAEFTPRPAYNPVNVWLKVRRCETRHFSAQTIEDGEGSEGQKELDEGSEMQPEPGEGSDWQPEPDESSEGRRESDEGSEGQQESDEDLECQQEPDEDSEWQQELDEGSEWQQESEEGSNWQQELDAGSEDDASQVQLTKITSEDKGAKRYKGRRRPPSLSLNSEDLAYVMKSMDEEEERLLEEEINRYAKEYGPRQKKPPKEDWETSSESTSVSFETLVLFEKKAPLKEGAIQPAGEENFQAEVFEAEVIQAEVFEPEDFEAGNIEADEPELQDIPDDNQSEHESQ